MNEPLYGVLLELSYDGAGYHGWASQKDGGAIADALLEAVRELDPHASSMRGTSRTDAGVHAEGQLVGFDSTRLIPPRGWVFGTNQNLPDDISVRAARAVPAGFNPRFAARAKRYRYRVLVDDLRDPHVRSRAWRVSPPVDLDVVAREAESALGLHDFAAFRAAGDVRAETRRTLTCIRVERSEDPRLFSVVVEGNAFLYNMVRILVGTLVDVGRGRLAKGAIARALASGNRDHAGMTAPSYGLTLEHITLALPEGSGPQWPE